MEDNFKFEIVSPEKVIFSDNTTMVTLPSYEGDMSVLKNHISIITFLRPGKIKVKKNDEINIDTKHPEFLDWKWINPSELPKVAVHFKINIYKKLKEELTSLNLN